MVGTGCKSKPDVTTGWSGGTGGAPSHPKGARSPTTGGPGKPEMSLTWSHPALNRAGGDGPEAAPTPGDALAHDHTRHC